MSDSEAREQRRLALLSSVQGTDRQTIEQHAFVQGIKHILDTTYMSTEASDEAFVELFPPPPRRLSALNVSSSLYYMFSFVMSFGLRA
jgi:hypothetical protein